MKLEISKFNPYSKPMVCFMCVPDFITGCVHNIVYIFMLCIIMIVSDNVAILAQASFEIFIRHFLF